MTPPAKPDSAASSSEPIYSMLYICVRFDPPETETHALREKDNIIEHLLRIGYDAMPVEPQAGLR